MVEAAFSIEAEFPCALQDLWAFVSYVPNQDHWVFGMSDSEVVGGGAIGVGSEIVGVSTDSGKSLRVTMVVREYDPPSRIAWENTDGEVPFVTRITCSGDEISSRMKYDVTLYPKTRLWKVMMGPLRPLANIVANKRLRDEIVHLREALERSA